jgi:hypothetical protein
VGQRVVRGAAHVGGVIVVEGSARVRAVLEPVYAAMGLAFDPATAGAVEDEIGPVAPERVAEALLAELRGRGFAPAAAPAGTFDQLLSRARSLEPRFRIAS